MIAPCGCPIPKIDRSPRGRRRVAFDAAREGCDRDTVFRVLRYYGESYLEALDLSLWAVQKVREIEQSEQKKAA